MDHSWRPRPPIQGNFCPTCSISHFPFCPPHFSFTENPRFQSHNDNFFSRPPFDPFLDHPGPNVNIHRPFVGNPNYEFGDRRPWSRNPSLDRDPYGQLHGQSQFGDSPMVNELYRDGLGPPSYDHSGVGFKRMRVDERGSSSFMGENHVNSLRTSWEDERRLKLIRDHGSVPCGSPQGRADLVSGFNRETKGYMQEDSVLARSFSNVDDGEHGKFDELGGVRNSTKLKPTSTFETNNLQDPGIGYFDRKETSFHTESDFNLMKYKEEFGLPFGQQYMESNMKEELEQSHYGQVENSLAHSLHKNGHSSHPDRYTNVEQAQRSRVEATLYNEGGNKYDSNLYNEGGNPYNSNTLSWKGGMKQPLFVSQNVHYPNFDTPNENYLKHDLQRIHPSDSMSMKERRYSDPTNWRDMSGLSAPYHEQRSSITVDYRTPINQLPEAYTMEHRMQQNQNFHTLGQLGDTTQSIGVNDLSQDGIQGPFRHQSLSGQSLHRQHNLHEEGGYPPIPASSNVGPTQASGVFSAPPPLPASPPPPVPLAPPRHQYSEPHASSSPPKASSSLFPIPVSSTAEVPSSHPPVPEAYSSTQTYYSSKPRLHTSTGFSTEEFHARQALSKKYLGDNQPFPLRHLSSDKPKVVDASHIFKQPHRTTRPDRIVIILRGLPGSGKSYLAKMLRDLEVENGGDAPRIHSMDDYFMTEVEKFEEGEASKSSGSVRAKKPVMKKVMEYCYEPEMEEAYRSSMLKAFKKTLDEGVFSFIIVDDRNLRVADFAQFWATAKRSGYEVYLLEATYKDPAGCAARNVHGFTQDDIQQMAGQWEEAPPLYLKLDIKPLLHGDDLEESGIQEVDMDTEDVDPSCGVSGSEDRNPENVTVPLIEGFAPDDPSNDDKRWYAEKGHPTEVKELRRSKWSDDLDEDDAQRTEDIRGNSSALSGLIQAYSKEGKSVRWGDQAIFEFKLSDWSIKYLAYLWEAIQVGKTGFSIGAAKRENILSLVIGPGSGYNLKSNPLPEEENMTPARYISESKRQNMFQEHMRAERESFKAVFDKRRHRIGGLNVEED